MTNPRGPYRVGALFSLISAALHILAGMVGGFSSEAFSWAPYGLGFAVIGYGLLQGWRWLAYVAFLALFIGGIVALANLWAVSAVPAWWVGLILAANWLGAAGLFVALWRPAPRGV